MQEYVALCDVAKKKVLWEIPMNEFDIRDVPNKQLLVFRRQKKASIFKVN
jgi:hypothetical protein